MAVLVCVSIVVVCAYKFIEIAALNATGFISYQIGAFNFAIKSLEEALRLDPYNPITRENLERSHYNWGRKLMDTDPREAFDQFVSAGSYATLFDVQREDPMVSAEEALKKLGLDPHSEVVWLSFSEKYLSRFDYDRAYVAYWRARRMVQAKQIVEPSWPLDNYLHVRHADYLLRLEHRLQMLWKAPKELPNAEVLVKYDLNSNSTVSNVRVEEWSDGVTVTKTVPPELQRSVVKLFHELTHVEPLPRYFQAMGVLHLTYKLGEKNPPYGVCSSMVLSGLTEAKKAKPIAVVEPDFSDYILNMQERMGRLIDRYWTPRKQKGVEFQQPCVAFKIDSKGSLAGLTIKTSSGLAEIDEQAKNFVTALSPFCELPAGSPAQVEFSYDFGLRKLTMNGHHKGSQPMPD